MKNDAIRQFVRRELRAVTVGAVATAIGIGGGLPAAMANPVGGAVVSGHGSITSPNATTTLINQQSNSLILNWSSFNVASNETVQFVQPSSTSVALNNILSQSPSQIFGKIDANGRVVLINPNGILFGRTAQLNVGSLIASSLELKEFDPTTGHLTFQSLSGSPGVIDNEGTITAGRGGSVALLGGTVLNNGLVVADYGTVAMGAGNVATLDFYGGGLLRLQVSGDLKSNSTGAAAAVQNNGQIQANGGQVVLTATATKDVFASAVDNAGVVKAARISNVGGVIELLGTDGTATNSGTLDASGADAASTGGTVTVTGNAVSLTSTARIDVSGAAGGGGAFIGGGLHGADSSIPNASATSVDSGASISADATNAGNGGTIVVWSNGTTGAHGNLSASGGTAGGDGGLIETSGQSLDVAGSTVRAAAPAGSAGVWLLDPNDVIIDHSTTAGSTVNGAGNNGNGASPVTDIDISNALANGTDVTIETSKPPAGSSTTVGEITFGPGVSITNDSATVQTLTLDADTAIDMTNATPPSISSGASPLNLFLNANVNGQASPASLGKVTLDGAINVNTLTVNATDAITQAGGSITVAGTTLIATGSGNDITLGSTSNAFTGGITLTGGAVTVANSIDTTLVGVNSTGSLTLDAGGGVAFGAVGTDSTTVTNGLVVQGVSGSGAAGGAATQAGTLSVGTTTSIDAGANAITLSNAANTFTGAVTLTGGAVTLANADATTLGGVNSATSLTLDAGGAVTFGTVGTDSTTVTNGLIVQGVSGSGAAGGAVTQAGTLSVGTTTSIDAGANAITLSNAANTFIGAVTLTGGAMTLANADATTLGGTNSASSLTLDAGAGVAFGTVGTDSTTVTNGLVVQGVSGSGAAGGAVTQAGTLSVGTTASIDAGTNAITLGNSGNSFGGNIVFTGAAVTLASSGALSSSGTASANLSETAGGTISEGLTGIQLTGIAGTNTATFTVTGATHDVDLGGAGNNFNREATTITASGGTVGNVRVADTNTTFVPLTLPGTLTSLVLSDSNAPIALAAETLTGVGVGTNLAGGSTTLDVTAGGAITQGGALLVTGTTALNANGGVSNVTLSNNTNAFSGAITLKGNTVTVANTLGTTVAGASTAGSLTLDAGGAVAFGAVGADSTTVTNGLTVQGVNGTGVAGGAVSQVGRVSVGTTASIDAGTNAITLSNAANTFVGAVTLTGGAVTLANADATTLGGVNSATSLTLDAGGAVTFGTVGTDSTTVTNGLIVQGVNGSGAAGGAVTQAGTLSVGTTASIDAGTNAITLGNSGNSFGGNIVFTGAAVTLASSGALSSSGTASANLSETAGGTISEGLAGIQLTGIAGTNTATFTVTGATHDVDLGGAGNNFNREATTITASGGTVGNVRVADTNTTFVPLTLPGTLTSLVLSDSNAPIALAAETLTGVGVGTNLAGGSTTLDVTAGGAITQGGALLVTGTTALNANGGASNVTLSNNTNAFSGAITLKGNTVTVANTLGTTVAGASTAGSLTLDAGGAVAFGAVGADSTTVTNGLTVQGVNGTGVAGGAVSQVGRVSVGTTASIDAGTNAITLSNAANTFVGAVTLTGGAVTLANADPTILGGVNSATSLTLDAGGAVTFGTVGTDSTTVTNGLIVQGASGGGAAGGAVSQVGRVSVGTAGSIDAGTNAITLSNAANTFVGVVTLTGGAVTLANADPTILGGVNSANSLTLDAGGAVTFGTVGADSTTVTNGLIVQGVSGSGAAGGAVSQVGTLGVGGTSNINTGGNATTLGNSGNSLGGNVAFAGAAVTLASSGALSSSGTASGNLSETAGGTISEGLAGIQLTGIAGTNTATFTVTGATHDVDLGSAGNNFNREATTIAASGGGTVGNVRVVDTNTTFVPLTLPGTLTSLVLSDSNAPISLASQTLTGVVGAGTNLAGGTTTLDVTAGGAITQQLGTSLNVTGSTSFSAGANAITVANASNIFTGNVAFTGGTVMLASDGALGSSGTASGNLSETAGGTISEGAGGIQLTTGTPGATATFTVTGATHDVDLGSASNNFNTDAVTIAASGGGTVGNVRVVDVNPTSLSVALPGTLTSLVLSDTHAPITLAGGTFTGVSETNLAGGTTTLAVTAGGAINQTAALMVTGTSAFSANGGASDINLSNAGNAFNGGVMVTGNNVTVANTVGTTVAGASTAGSLTLDAGGAVAFGATGSDSTTVTGNVVAQGLSGSGATGGPVTQAGTLSVGGTTWIDAGSNDITLSNPGNSFTGAVTLMGGSVTLANSGATTLGGANSAASLTLDAGGTVTFGTLNTDSTAVTNDLIVQGASGGGAAGGAVSQVGTLSVGDSTSIDTNNAAITLDNAANSFAGNVSFTGGAVTLTSAGALTTSGTASGNLAETAGGKISEGAAGILLTGTAGTNTATFTVTGGTQDVDLDPANNFNGEATTITASGGGAVGNVAVEDTNATFVPLTLPTTFTSLVLSDPNAPIAIAGVTLTGVGAGTNLIGGTTTLAVTAGGAITQTDALAVTGTSAFSANGGASDINLSNAANAFNGGILLTGNNVTLANTVATTVAGTSAAGNLTLNAGGAVSQTGAVSVAGTTSINAGTNAVTLSNAANAFAGAVTLTGGAMTLANSRATTLVGANSAGSLTLDAGGAVAFGASGSDSTTVTNGLIVQGVNGSGNAGGAVTQAGKLSVGTTAAITAGANDITLGLANTFGGNVAFGGHNVTLTTGTGGLMTSGAASGNLTETAAGAITQGGALSVAGRSTLKANGGAGDITLANAGNAFTGAVTLSGAAVTLANADATTLAGAEKFASLTLDAGGAVTFGTVSTDTTTVTNALIVQGVSGSGNAGGAITQVGTLSVGTTTLIQAGAYDINLGLMNTFGGGVSFNGRNVLLNAKGSLTTVTGTASGTLTAIAQGASANLNVGNLTAGGDLLLIAGSSILGTSAQATVTATDVQVRYGIEDANGQLGSATNPSQQIGFQAAPGASQVQLTVWLPAPGTQLQGTDLRPTQSDLSITKQAFQGGSISALYLPNFGLTAAQVGSTVLSSTAAVAGTQTQSAQAQSAATQGSQSVLYIDWGSYNPNVSLFGTLNPAVCLPADQRDESGGSGSSCAAASASLLKPPAPIQLAMVPTREGWKAMPLFKLVR